MIRIVIIGDQILLTETLAKSIEDQADIEIAGTGECAEQALELCKKCQPDMVLLDIYPERGNGIDAAKQIKLEMPGVKVLLLSAFSDEYNIRLAMNAGVDGFVDKDVQLNELLFIIRQTMQKYRIFPALKESATASASEHSGFSYMELNILSLLLKGRTSKEISQQLFLSHGTVRNYISRMILRHGLKDRLQLVLYAVKEGYLSGMRGS